MLLGDGYNFISCIGINKSPATPSHQIDQYLRHLKLTHGIVFLSLSRPVSCTKIIKTGMGTIACYIDMNVTNIYKTGMEPNT